MDKNIQQNLDKIQILNFLKENKNFLNKEFGVIKIALFGSYAKNEARIESDIDILVQVKKKSFDNRFDIKEFLEKNLKRNVDLFYFDSVRPSIMHEIEKDLKVE
ncbi:MAG: nucleotidyltransferase domain-containing protein [Candidatus Babeliales bacterium]